MTDGFTGNVALKTMEGFAGFLLGNLREVFDSGMRGRLAYLLVRKRLRAMRERFDPSEYGGAPLLGVAGRAIIAHGSSDARAIRNALRAAANESLGDALNDDIVEMLGKMSATVPSRMAGKGIRAIFGRMRERLHLRRKEGELPQKATAPSRPAPSAPPKPEGACRRSRPRARTGGFNGAAPTADSRDAALLALSTTQRRPLRPMSINLTSHTTTPLTPRKISGPEPVEMVKPMKLALLFPGQGSQKVGMGRQLVNDFPAARSVFEQADSALGMSLSRLCFEGPEEELRLTANTQPAILTTSIAALRALQSEFALAPEVAAGHSLGEYSALVAAGALDFDDAVRRCASAAG